MLILKKTNYLTGLKLTLILWGLIFSEVKNNFFFGYICPKNCAIKFFLYFLPRRAEKIRVSSKNKRGKCLPLAPQGRKKLEFSQKKGELFIISPAGPKKFGFPQKTKGGNVYH